MKWFACIILLLANVIYFGWELLRETGMTVQSVSALKIPATAKRLTLLSELTVLPDLREAGPLPGTDESASPNDAATSAIALVSDEGAPAHDLALNGSALVEGLIDELPEVEMTSLEGSMSKASCFRFGPIPEELQANGLSDWFSSRQAITNIRYKEEQPRQLFWIYLAPQQSRQAALAVLDDFKGKGISDYRLISHGDLRHAISLGIFSSQAAMNNRLGELQEKGYQPVIVPYDNVRRIYWVDVRLQVAPALVEEVFRGHPSRYHSVPVDCSETALADL